MDAVVKILLCMILDYKNNKLLGPANNSERSANDAISNSENSCMLDVPKIVLLVSVAQI